MCDHAISEWRRAMQRAGIDDPATLDELEAHLREEMERRVADGATEEEALRGAMQKLGKPEAIREEFAKELSPSRERLKRRLRAAVVALCCASIAFLALSVVKPRSYDVGIFFSRHLESRATKNWFYSGLAVPQFGPGCYPFLIGRDSAALEYSMRPLLPQAPPLGYDGPYGQYYWWLINFGKKSVGIVKGRPALRFWTGQKWKSIDPESIKLWEIVGCILVMLPLLSREMISGWAGRALFLVLGLLMLTVAARNKQVGDVCTIPLFILPQMLAYLVQGWWLCLQMRRRAGPSLAMAEVT
jgi:hypothetical protein